MYSMVPVCTSVSDPLGFYADPVGMLSADPDRGPALRMQRSLYIHINRVAEPGDFKTVAASIFFLNMILAPVSESNCINNNFLNYFFIGKKSLPCCSRFIMRQYYIITQEANKLKKVTLKFCSNRAFSRFLKSFWPKHCHSSVMVRDN
jgi:hypothetical protein